jgi:transcriptional regulator with XRE-family HTH domain
MSDSKYYIPNRLRKYRRDMGYSQQYVAKKLKLPSSCNLSRWEKGLTRPSIEDLLKLSLLYNTLVEQLYADLKETLREELQLNSLQQHGK